VIIHFEGWIFINYLALVYYYRLYQRLMEKELLNLYSHNDVLFYLSKYRRVKISKGWIELELPKQTKKILHTLDLHIP